MKMIMKAVILVAMILLVGCPAPAGTPTPSVDTVLMDGAKLFKFVARWNIVPDTAASDTLTSPGWGSRVEITHKGAAGDTVWVSLAQGTYSRPYSLILITAGQILSLDFRGAYVKKLYVKSNHGTAKAWIQVMN